MSELRQKYLKNAKKIVVKVGSRILVDSRAVVCPHVCILDDYRALACPNACTLCDSRVLACPNACI